jgi:peptide/nickel transport system substrate-binding protein
MKKMSLVTCFSVILMISVSIALFLTACAGNVTTPTAANQASPKPTAIATTPSSSVASNTAATTATASITAATPTTSSAAPKYGGTLKYADPFFPDSNLGWTSDPRWGGMSSYLFLEPLLKTDANGVVSPWLATKWEVAQDLKSLTLTLRQGVKFHDGSDFNAAIAKWNIDNFITAKAGDFVFVSSVDIVDNSTIKLNLTQFSNSILTTLSDRYFMISKAAYDAHGGNKDTENWMRQNPVGTGPFKLSSFRPSVSVKGVKFDGYWQKGMPYLDSIEGISVADPMTRSMALQAGDVDMIAGDLTKVEYDLSQKGGYLPIDKFYLALLCLMPDSKNPNSPLSNLKVRQAIDYAIDRESIVKTLGYGFWVATQQYAIPGSRNYATDITPRNYNVDKAKQLLAEAGYPNGFSTQILCVTGTTNKDALTSIQSDLSQVGIKAELKWTDQVTATTTNQKGWDGFIANPKPLNANMNIVFSTNFSQKSFLNVSLLKTNEFEALFNASATSPNYDPVLIQKVIKYMYDNVELNCVYAVSHGYVMRPYLHDLGVNNQANGMAWTPATAWMSK